MTYSDKLAVVQEFLDYKDMLLTGPDLLKIMSLASYLTVAARKKNPEIKPYDILIKAVGEDNNHKLMKELLEMISINCDLFITERDQKYYLYGCKTAKEILDLIKETLNNWVPF